MSDVMERLDRILAKVPRGVGGTREEAAGAGAAAARLVHDDADGEGLVLMALTRAEAAEVRAWRAKGDARGVEDEGEEDDVPASGPPPVDVRDVVVQAATFAQAMGRGLDLLEEFGVLPKRSTKHSTAQAREAAKERDARARTRRRG